MWGGLASAGWGTPANAKFDKETSSFLASSLEDEDVRIVGVNRTSLNTDVGWSLERSGSSAIIESVEGGGIEGRVTKIWENWRLGEGSFLIESLYNLFSFVGQ